jgi:hypothetical protein
MSFLKRLFGQQQTPMDEVDKAVIQAMTDEQLETMLQFNARSNPLETMLQDETSNWKADVVAFAKAELTRRRTACRAAPDTSSTPVASAPPQTPLSHGGEGISKLLRCFRREVFGEEMRALLSEAVGDLQAEGAAGSHALAALMRDLLKCRSREICSALSIAKELEPTPELISEIKTVQSAPQIVEGVPGVFAPEILGDNQVGWTNFTHARVRDFAKEAIDTLSAKLNVEASPFSTPGVPTERAAFNPEGPHTIRPGGDLTGAAPNVAAQLKVLGQQKYPEWLEAYQALERIGSQAVPSLLDAVQSDTHLLRMRALNLLGKIGDERAIDVLKRASEIEQENFKRLCTVSGSRVVLKDGTVLDVPFHERWQEYREDAHKALDLVQQRVDRRSTS